jgi:hypothetical protein
MRDREPQKAGAEHRAEFDTKSFTTHDYWRVDQAGIHQHWLGFRNWSLSWNEIVSRRLGPVASPAWLFLIFVPIAGGPYQPIVLEDRQGRKRKVNRLGTNGDRLDAFLRQYLNPTGEAHRAQTYANAIQNPDYARLVQELNGVTPDSRMHL